MANETLLYSGSVSPFIWGCQKKKEIPRAPQVMASEPHEQGGLSVLPPLSPETSIRPAEARKMTNCRGCNGSTGSGELLTPQPKCFAHNTYKNIQGTEGLKSLPAEPYGHFRLQQPLKRTKTTLNIISIQLYWQQLSKIWWVIIFWGDDTCVIQHFLLYLLWKAWLHLCGLLWECLEVWRFRCSPELLGCRLHKRDFCNPEVWWALCGPLWSLGTPSMTSMANNTTSKPIICMVMIVDSTTIKKTPLLLVRWLRTRLSQANPTIHCCPCWIPGFPWEGADDKNPNQRSSRKFQKTATDCKHRCTSHQEPFMLLPLRSARYTNPCSLGQSPKSSDNVPPPPPQRTMGS